MIKELKISNHTLEYTFYILGILLLLRAFIPVIEGHHLIEGRSEDSSIVSVISTLVLLIGSIYILLKHRNISQFIFKNNLLLFALIFVALISIIWSVNPGATLTRSTALLGITLFGFCMAIRLHPKQLLNLLILATVITAVASIIYSILFPQLGIHQDFHSGNLRGIFMHKNHLGRAMMYGIVALLCITLYDGYVKKTSITAFIILSICLFFTQSMTAILLSFVAICISIMLYMWRKQLLTRNKVLSILFILLFFTSTLIYSNFENIIKYLGREGTFLYGGRIPLWIEILMDFHAGNHKALGYGYGAYFQSEDIRMVRAGWNPHNMHNGYLQLLIDLGYTGLLLFSILLFSCFKRIIEYTKWFSFRVWLPLFFFIILLLNITEAHLLNFRWFAWVMFTYIYLVMSIYNINLKA